MTARAAASPFDAFLSYSRDDAVAAEWLWRHLTRFGRPWYRRRGARIFRDTSNLSAGPSLAGALSDALGRSRFLVVLASQASARSTWVEKEVATWLETRGLEEIVIVRLTRDAPLPARLVEQLKQRREEEPTYEPIYVDLEGLTLSRARDPDVLRAVAQVVARLRGTELDELIGEDLRLYRRARRTAALVSVFVLMLIAGGVLALRRAQMERARAERERSDRKRQADVAAARSLTADSRKLLLDHDSEGAALRAIAAYTLGGEEEGLSALVDLSLAMDRLVGEIRASSVMVGALAFDAPKNLLVSGDNEGTVGFWNVDTRAVARRVSSVHAEGVARVACSPQGSKCASSGGSLALWNMADLSHEDSTEMKAFGLAFAPDGKTLAVGGDGGRIVLLDLERHEATRAAIRPSDMTILSLIFDSSGKKLLSTSFSSGRLWKVPDLKEVASFDFDPSAGSEIDLTGDGQRALFAGGTALVQWAIDDGGAYGDPVQSAPRRMGPALFLSKRELLVAEDRELVVIDAEPRPFGLHAAEIASLAIDRAHALVASGDAAGVIRLWSLDRGVTIARPLLLGDPELTPVALALSSDGQRAAVAATDVHVDFPKGSRTSTRGVIQVFDANTGRPMGAPRALSQGTIAGLAFSASGDVVEAEAPTPPPLSVRHEGPAAVWSTATGKRWTATLRRNDEIALFDAKSKRLIAVLVPGNVSTIRAVPGCLSPVIVADRLLATINGTATLLDLAPAKLLRRACDLAGQPSPAAWHALGAPGTFADACASAPGPR